MNPVIEAPTRLPTVSPETVWITVVTFVALVLLRLWIGADAARYLSKLSLARRRNRVSEPLPEPNWEALHQRAERVVDETIAALPDEVKAEAVKLPCLLRKRAQELYGREALGLHKGFQPGRVSEHAGPIVIFIGDIHSYCAENELDFEDEIRTTYLHELGHHLGWDEDELQDRGLG